MKLQKFHLLLTFAISSWQISGQLVNNMVAGGQRADM